VARDPSAILCGNPGDPGSSVVGTVSRNEDSAGEKGLPIQRYKIKTHLIDTRRSGLGKVPH
jgi:hypothetical protein